MNILPRHFYNRPTLTVARELIGARLVRILDGVKLVGIITETEGYVGEEDLACHAKAGRTPRTLPMGLHLPGLLTILGEHLYSDPTVALREALQADPGQHIHIVKTAGFPGCNGRMQRAQAVQAPRR